MQLQRVAIQWRFPLPDRLVDRPGALRGRAGLEMVVPTFDFRCAADFWGIADHRLAALVFFVVGGTPAYRTEYLRGAAPASVEDFDGWVVEYVLNPASPLFREARALLAEDPNLRDTGLYHTVLAAVAEGNATRGGIANRIERKASDISHHLTVLEDAGLLKPEPDAFRANRSECEGRPAPRPTCPLGGAAFGPQPHPGGRRSTRYPSRRHEGCPHERGRHAEVECGAGGLPQQGFGRCPGVGETR